MSCSICAGEIMDDGKAFTTRCGHTFHIICMQDWVKLKNYEGVMYPNSRTYVEKIPYIVTIEGLSSTGVKIGARVRALYNFTIQLRHNGRTYRSEREEIMEFRNVRNVNDRVPGKVSIIENRLSDEASKLTLIFKLWEGDKYRLQTKSYTLQIN